MSTELMDFALNLERAPQAGRKLADHLVLRALRTPEIAEMLESLFADGYSLADARPVASRTAGRAEVMFRLDPPVGSKWLSPPCVLGVFETATSKFVSVSPPLASLGTPREEFGAAPFAMTARCYSHAMSVTDDDPDFAELRAKRDAFLDGLGVQTRASNTVEATAVDTPYGTSERTTNDGTDYDTQTDHSRDWENDYSVDP